MIAVPPKGGWDWSIDRRVPVALIVSLLIAMLGQAGLIVWWGSGVNSAVANQETRIARLEQDNKTNSDVMTDVKVLLGRIDERTRLFTDALKTLQDKK